jgi:hypothetical protein
VTDEKSYRHYDAGRQRVEGSKLKTAVRRLKDRLFGY